MKNIIFITLIFCVNLNLALYSQEMGIIKPKGTSDARKLMANIHLIKAVRDGDVNSTIEEIEKWGANPSYIDQNEPALCMAIKIGILNDRSNYADVAKILIEKGADVNATNQDGFTPLDLLFVIGAQGMRNIIRERTRDVFKRKLYELLISKGAIHSDKFSEERKRIGFLQ